MLVVGELLVPEAARVDPIEMVMIYVKAAGGAAVGERHEPVVSTHVLLHGDVAGDGAIAERDEAVVLVRALKLSAAPGILRARAVRVGVLPVAVASAVGVGGVADVDEQVEAGIARGQRVRQDARLVRELVRAAKLGEIMPLVGGDQAAVVHGRLGDHEAENGREHKNEGGLGRHCLSPRSCPHRPNSIRNGKGRFVDFLAHTRVFGTEAAPVMKTREQSGAARFLSSVEPRRGGAFLAPNHDSH